MQSLFSRVKRQAISVKTGDLQLFRTKNGAYLNFIEELKSVFTESDEIYSKIKVTKREPGITKVNIKDGATQVSFIYLNRDLYIIGFVVGSTFYIDQKVHENNRIPSGWTSVVGTSKVEVLSNPLSYDNILPSGENTVLQMDKIGESLKKLTEIGDKNKRIGIMAEHVGPFVVAFSEAIRFPVVAREVQEAIRKERGTGTLNLSMNLVKKLSLGHPSQRTDEYVFNMYSLFLNWGKLSDKILPLYSNPPRPAKPIQEGTYTLRLEKDVLSVLLGVANSQGFSEISTASIRSKRDLASILDHAILQYPALLDQQFQLNHIGYEGNVEQPFPREFTSGIASITQSPDWVGALHLLSVGLLYLYGKKMNVPIGTNQRDLDPHEAYGVAVDLMDRIECFLGSSGLELELGFEEKMQLQRELTRALVHGEQVEPILTKVLNTKFPVEQDNPGGEKAREQLSKALATDSGLLEKHNFEDNECFQ